MIQAALAGTGPNWQRYQSALSQLRRPLHVAAVFDCTPALARDNSAAPVSGMQALARRADVQAILLMDAGWTGLAGLELLATSRRPVLVADWVGADRHRLERIHALAVEAGATIMPTMWRRYMPASIRLQELMATDLGLPQSIELSIPLTDRTATNGRAMEPLIGWIDYCRNLFRSFPDPVSLDARTSGSEACTLRMEFPSGSRTDTAPARQAVIHLVESDADESATAPQIDVTCTGGTARIRDRHELEWQSGDRQPQSEVLTSDRSEEEIMLDLFCRRVVGGLIPVADFNDLVHAVRVLEEVGLPHTTAG